MTQKPNPERVISHVNSNKGVEYHILGVDTWDHFDSLVAFFKKHYGAKIIFSEDAIYTRKCILESGNEKFALEHHEDIGNYFYSINSRINSDFMEKISGDLDKRLRKVEYTSTKSN